MNTQSKKGAYRIALLIIGFAVTLGACSNSSAQEYKTVSVQTVDSLRHYDSSITILDVRTPEEYVSESGHLPKAKLIPVTELDSRIAELTPDKGKTIVVYCHSGRRSATASGMLASKGYHVLNMDGGITAWNSAGLPTEKGATP